jgi:site-specific DNA-methyltransferase (adenine-specific)
MTYQLHLGDCLEFMKSMPDKSVDAIITDLPYGTTACSWDVIIPFEPMWEQVKRICKGVFVTTASQPFTSKLVMSNLDWFRYEWSCSKSHASGFQYAKFRPMQRHDNILVFGKGNTTYNPQISKGIRKASRSGTPIYNRDADTVVGGGIKKILSNVINNDYYPTTDIYFDWGARCESLHPTQKPVALYDYLIRTYTNPDDTVLDICMGSGTTGVAAIQLGRNFIGCEIDPTYYAIAEKRIHEATLQPQLFTSKPIEETQEELL